MLETDTNLNKSNVLAKSFHRFCLAWRSWLFWLFLCELFMLMFYVHVPAHTMCVLWVCLIKFALALNGGVPHANFTCTKPSMGQLKKHFFENLHRYPQFQKNMIVASLIVIIDFQNQWNIESNLALQACIWLLTFRVKESLALACCCE